MKGQSKTSGCREAAKTFKNRLTLSEALDVAVIGDLPLCNPVPQVFRKVYFTHVYLGQISVCTHVNYKKKIMAFYIWIKVSESTCIAKARRKLWLWKSWGGL